MLQTLYTWMRDIMIFMIGITILLQLIGKNSYKKYVKFIAGMLLILFIAKPLINILDKDGSFLYLFHSYDALLEAKDNANVVLSAEEGRNTAILLEYKNLLANQTEQLLKTKGLTLLSMDLELDETMGATTYGSIQRISIAADYQKEEKSNYSVSDVVIEKIIISIGEKENMNEMEENITQGKSPLEISTKNMLADFYNLEPEHINIIIREDNNG